MPSRASFRVLLRATPAAASSAAGAVRAQGRLLPPPDGRSLLLVTSPPSKRLPHGHLRVRVQPRLDVRVLVLRLHDSPRPPPAIPRETECAPARVRRRLLRCVGRMPTERSPGGPHKYFASRF
eukprot:31093-Pelagococcus_subviridis.AAC.5